MKSEGFFMDEQTFADLNVHQTDKNLFSIYGLFKKTKTVGGRERLEEMLRKPTNNIAELKYRSDAISSFMKGNVDLDIYHDQFDLILHYLKFEKHYSTGNLIDSSLAYIANEFRESPSYYTIRIGLKQLLNLIRYSAGLAKQLQNLKSNYLEDLSIKLTNVLSSPLLAYAVEMSEKQNLRFHEIGKLDSVIRRDGKLLIFELLHLFYELDILETVARVSKRDGFCTVTYLNQDAAVLDIEALFYPGIKKAVRNDFRLDPTQHCIFLTGSNMAGKSSLLRSIATCVYLAHLGFPVPATRMSTTVLNGLITTINLGDDFNSGLSQYLNEVIRVRKIAEVLNQQNKLLILLDELFRGTNPEDALAASDVVIRGFSKIKDSGFVVSSHLSQLTNDLKDLDIVFKHLEHVMDSEGLRFTYKLKDGVSLEGIGMHFIHREGIAKLLAQAGRD